MWQNKHHDHLLPLLKTILCGSSSSPAPSGALELPGWQPPQATSIWVFCSASHWNMLKVRHFLDLLGSGYYFSVVLLLAKPNSCSLLQSSQTAQRSKFAKFLECYYDFARNAFCRAWRLDGLTHDTTPATSVALGGAFAFSRPSGFKRSRAWRRRWREAWVEESQGVSFEIPQRQ